MSLHAGPPACHACTCSPAQTRSPESVSASAAQPSCRRCILSLRGKGHVMMEGGEWHAAPLHAPLLPAASTMGAAAAHAQLHASDDGAAAAAAGHVAAITSTARKAAGGQQWRCFLACLLAGAGQEVPCQPCQHWRVQGLHGPRHRPAHYVVGAPASFVSRRRMCWRASPAPRFLPTHVAAGCDERTAQHTAEHTHGVAWRAGSEWARCARGAPRRGPSSSAGQ